MTTTERHLANMMLIAGQRWIETGRPDDLATLHRRINLKRNNLIPIIIMIRKWMKKLLAPIVREVLNEEKLQEQVIGHIVTALKEALDSGECDNLKRPNV